MARVEYIVKGLAFGILAFYVFSCGEQEKTILTGRVIDAKTGDGIDSAQLASKSQSSVTTLSSSDGYYVLEGFRKDDTVVVLKAGYHPAVFASGVLFANVNRPTRDVYLDPIIDTAFTPSGPVDASLFLESTSLRRKKLSLNEARRILNERLPQLRFRKGMLVTVNNEQEWMFESNYGHALVIVYLNALTGRLRSIESDDPLIDRRLQEFVEE